MSRLRVLRPGLVAVLAMGGLLVGCAEDEPGPQFASDPRPSQVATEVASVATPSVAALATPVVAATPASIGELVNTRGGAPRVYIASNNAIWSISSGGEASRIFEARDGSRLLAIDPAPGAGEVAALLETQSGGARSNELLILENSGKTLARETNFSPNRGTPEAGAVSSADVVNWSPQGDQVIVALAEGPLSEYRLGDNATLTTLDVKAAGAEIIRPEWSPTGETIAYIASDESGRNRALRVLNIKDGNVQDVVTPTSGRYVADFTWMPDGVSLLFTEGGELGGAVTGIDLWRINANGEQRQLLVSAGTVAPVAQITNMRPSPDGRSVAYVVLVPGAETPRVDSVWVRGIDSGPGFRVSLPSIAAVNDLWWTDRGLAISVITGDEDGQRAEMLALLQLMPDGTVAALWAAPLASATPGRGTPQATPGLN